VAETKFSTLRVGMVMAIGIALMAFAVFTIGKGSRLIVSSATFFAHFHRTNGLQAGAPVSLSGVNIGSVESIRFPTDPARNYVVVKLWVEASAATRIHADTEAQIKTMGLLGDKYVELTSGSPASAPAELGSVLKSADPIDYEALLSRPGSQDFLANVVAATTSLRDILESVERGQGLLGELVFGPKDKSKQVTLESIDDTLNHLNRLAQQLDQAMARVNRGEGLAGAMLSSKTNGKKVVADLTESAATMREVSRRMDDLTDRLAKAQGTIPRLVEDRQLADQLVFDLRRSAQDMQQILDKINSGQGTVGAMVNDPSLYYEAKGMLSEGGGWGWSLLRGLYSVTHPFAKPSGPPPETTQAGVIGTIDGGNGSANGGNSGGSGGTIGGSGGGNGGVMAAPPPASDPPLPPVTTPAATSH
jgi:phospholipid/cholesterol/gamma-HCH transport system substrate-binding protein